MMKTLTLAIAFLQPSVAAIAAETLGHPFRDEIVAAQFGQNAMNRELVHHEELRCGSDEVRFEISVELPFPGNTDKRNISITSPDCAFERKTKIEKELLRMPRSAFKKVAENTTFHFVLTARYAPE